MGCKNLNTAWEGIWLLNTQAKTSYVNQQMADMLGYSVVEMLGQLFFNFIDAAVRVEVEQYFKQLRQGTEKQYDCKFRRKDGSALLASISISPVFSEKGEFTGVVGLVTDPTQRQQDQEMRLRTKVAEADNQQLEREIAERKQVESALAKSEERHRMISELTSDFAYAAAITPDGHWFVEWVTEAFLRITGYTLADIKGPRGWISMIYPDDLPLVEHYYQTLLSGQVSESDLRIITKDGDIRWLRSYARPEWDEAQQRVIRMLGAAKDITEHKCIEEALSRALKEQEIIMETITDVFYVLDLNGNLLKWNKRLETITGLPPEKLKGRLALAFFPEVERGTIAQAIREVFEKGKAEVEGHLLGKDKVLLPYDWNGVALKDEAGNVVGVTGIGRDISERKQAEVALAKSEAKFRSLIQNSLGMITLLEADGTVQYESPSIEKIVGYKPEDLLGKNIFEFIHLEDAETVLNAFGAVIQNPGATLTVEFRFQHQDGSWRVLEATGNNLLNDPSVGSVVINSHDITERKWAEEQLRHNALYDELTDLANRTLFMNQLEHAFKRAKRRNYKFAVLFLDLDRFKVINDSLGHTIGDQLLVAVSQRLKACLREIDTIARFGGDEFAILLNDIKEVDDATHTAERIKKALTLPLNLSGREVFSSVSIGIAVSTTSYSQPEDLLRDADTALYRAKALGKGRHEIFDTDMHTHAVTLLQLETDLRQAIERQEFKIHYQPIISLETSRIAGFEALVRWQHPRRGLVSPAEFIPIAEETGLIVLIGWWILREACRQMQAWQTQSPAMLPLAISVNLSVKQFTQPELVEQIDRILWETRLNASSLRLEITESVLIENPTSATDILSQLTALGVQLYMDDFGTGYSSLSYLHRFPVSALKIDRSFIRSMNSGDKNSEIVRAITTLALALGIDVIAEGVETVDQLAQLRALKCKYAQGYLFAKPMDAEAAGALVKNPQWCN